MGDLIEQARDIGAWLDGQGFRTMADMMENIAVELENRVDKAQAWDAATAVPRKTADEIAALRERVADTEGVLKAIRALIGNVDHLRGHGSNAAGMRGGMLNDIRDLTDAALSRPNDGGVS